MALVRTFAQGRDALIQLEQKAACTDADALIAQLPSLDLTLNNHSGAEYSFYDATAPGTGAKYTTEVIWPASSRQIARKTPADSVLAEETGKEYEAVVEPYVAEQAGKIGWIDAVCSLEKVRSCSCHCLVATATAAVCLNADPLAADPAASARRSASAICLQTLSSS